MTRSIAPRAIRSYRGAVAALLLAALSASGGLVHAGEPELSPALRSEIYAPVERWLRALEGQRDADGVRNKIASCSRSPRRLDETAYEVTAHVDIAGPTEQKTERYVLTVTRTNGRRWEIGDARVVDTHVSLYRTGGIACSPYGQFSFDREGLKLSASDGTVCGIELRGELAGFVLHGAGMTWAYEPPEHAGLIQSGRAFRAIHAILARERARELAFVPAAFVFHCDARSCAELVERSFRNRAEPAPSRLSFGDPAVPVWLRPLADRIAAERREDPFAHFRLPDRPDRRWYDAFVVRELEPLVWASAERTIPGSGVALSYDSWASWEVLFQVLPRRTDLPDPLLGALYGYFTEQTLRSNAAGALERRPDVDGRWYEVQAVQGTVDLGLDHPETIDGDVAFRLTLLRPLRELPVSLGAGFLDWSWARRAEPAALSVNSVRLDDAELTWVRTGRGSGLVVLPEELPAGSELTLRMSYSAEAIRRYTDSLLAVDHFAWIPFLRFGDLIDRCGLTIRTPARYQILGIGAKTSERVEGDVRISRWESEHPVTFPSVVFGKYVTDRPRPGFELPRRSDGTPIDVAVHVDENSFVRWGIRPGALRSIAEQAANALALYGSITGLDYPYGELNLVNDGQGVLYGQAPSSLIHLGSGVFRGEGFLASLAATGKRNPTAITRFLKSVTAHEVAHQWWGSMIVHLNERNYWFTESLAEYFAALYLESVHGYDEYRKTVDAWRRTILQHGLRVSVQDANTLGAAAGGGAASALLHAKGPYAFHILRETFRGAGARGPAEADRRFYDFLGKLTRKLAEKREIVTADIQRAAEQALGGVDVGGEPWEMDLEWFFEQWIRGTGIPEYVLDWDVSRAEDGAFVVEGTVRQRVVVGGPSRYEVLDGVSYRGRAPLTITTRGGEHTHDLVVQGPVTTFRVEVSDKPIDVRFNESGAILALDVRAGKGR